MGSTWKIGELARATGLTVRTLHHYDEIGLLSPSLRTAAGHRLYTGDDVAGLYRVLALRQLGFRLEQIAGLLRTSGSPRAVMDEHMFHVKRQIAAGQRLHARLVALARSLDRHEEPTTADFLTLLEEMRMTDETINRYYTDEQLSYLAQRGEELGPDAIRAVEAEWPRSTPAPRPRWRPAPTPPTRRSRRC
jgi:DNA-binding transcriptional MerR regulator